MLLISDVGTFLIVLDKQARAKRMQGTEAGCLIVVWTNENPLSFYHAL
jgi:hypothetical protein